MDKRIIKSREIFKTQMVVREEKNIFLGDFKQNYITKKICEKIAFMNLSIILNEGFC